MRWVRPFERDVDCIKLRGVPHRRIGGPRPRRAAVSTEARCDDPALLCGLSPFLSQPTIVSPRHRSLIKFKLIEKFVERI